jgi:threonine aldolase
MINLISDTVTRPTPEMLKVMFDAEVGDDVFREDPTVNALEARAAAMFNKEGALFCPSGTMTNQLAIKMHTQALDEVVCNINSHVYQYETGAYGLHSRVAVNLLPGEDGKVQPEQVRAAIKPDYDWLPRTRLLVIENTCNKGGGTIYSYAEMQALSSLCREQDLRIHLDGARLFNALVETGDTTQAIGPLFDSISICLSKGLGAPVGSLLIGSSAFIRQARRFRKAMGGGMRQAGYLAAAGLYALEHHVDRLKEDNARAKRLGKALSRASYVAHVRPVQSNIVIFDVAAPLTAEDCVSRLKGKGIGSSAFGKQAVRLVTHLDVSEEMIDRTIAIIESLY